MRAAGRESITPGRVRDLDLYSEPAPAHDPVARYLVERFPGFEPGRSWEAAANAYPAAALPEYLDLIREPSQNDPVFRQVAPSAEELILDGEEDPVSEQSFSAAPGLIHRYPDRVLVMPTTNCFVRCRHCMRKRTWGEEEFSSAGIDKMQRAWTGYLAGKPEVGEVIISGGDPLTLADKELYKIIDSIRVLPGMRSFRIHTRAVVAAPSRISAGLSENLRERGVARIVTQFNHPVEISERAAGAVQTLLAAGIKVENQAVLLRGVNDSAEDLVRLFRGLLEIGVRPYYLHHPDPVRGAMHFMVSMERGWEIFSRTRVELPLEAVPEYVVDLPGKQAKTLVEALISRKSPLSSSLI